MPFDNLRATSAVCLRKWHVGHHKAAKGETQYQQKDDADPDYRDNILSNWSMSMKGSVYVPQNQRLNDDDNYKQERVACNSDRRIFSKEENSGKGLHFARMARALRRDLGDLVARLHYPWLFERGR